MQYLDELQSPVKEMTDTVWTGDETVTRTDIIKTTAKIVHISSVSSGIKSIVCCDKVITAQLHCPAF